MIFTGRKKYRPSQRGHWDQDRDMYKSCIFPFLAFLLKTLSFFTSLFFLKYLSKWRQRSIVVKNAGKQAKEIYLSLTSDSSNSLAGVCVSVCVCSVVHGLQPARLLCLWNLPSKDTGVCCHFLLQGIFPNQGLNLRLLCLLHWQAVSLPLCHSGSPHWLYNIRKILGKFLTFLSLSISLWNG